jgi:hypothetical protein
MQYRQLAGLGSRGIVVQVFISWSGGRSKRVAEELATWLRQVIQAAEPWISTAIDKGVPWSREVSERLEQSRIGIICLTRENLAEPWILFEAGALAKTKDAKVCTFLLDVHPTDVKPPLGHFQHTTLAKEEVRKLIGTINSSLEGPDRPVPDATLDRVFERSWQELDDVLTPLARQQPHDPSAHRTDRELLQEILQTSRYQAGRLTQMGLWGQRRSPQTINLL